VIAVKKEQFYFLIQLLSAFFALTTIAGKGGEVKRELKSLAFEESRARLYFLLFGKIGRYLQSGKIFDKRENLFPFYGSI